ncbi:hypothetical protein HanRHA438_Chr03g0127551 [Helianthus annuus]|uniref:Uncharacterized protein n=1 Tax=Helianthus annuus TaxID=4232 RepID=A0A9K3JHQ3_HELAN|nr:hypothetical protein HanXRQr2_Chr03g0115701 [Helianthus annuus]KAJ0593407.1 hypothetical protein HanHA300_Chr03g0096641 [Helianthus annuus]KAJ0601278.1 hypothetical protein HanIR_Chr03g0126541 [Helianthus annuus]KAJ0608418.1 hypothetical protein HanHA89_Chr03g0108331 [Helianthus annuus]KAJ0768481.1 hypothetical protein HanLR1_Chr03g0101691 [Helianthus annuus]
MSSCTNCDCFDKANCTTEETIVMEVPAAENNGNCKCGANCSCTNCTCGH